MIDPSHSSSALTTPIELNFTPSSNYFKPLPPCSPSVAFEKPPSKPLPTPPPVKDSDLLDMVTLLQSVNHSMKALNASLSSLSEDMSSIETMLITRELLIRELSGQLEGVDSMEESNLVGLSTGYLRHLYRKLSQASQSYTH